MASAPPRLVWTWTAPPPEGKCAQVWRTAAGHPLEVEINVSDLTPPSTAPDPTLEVEIEVEIDVSDLTSPRIAPPATVAGALPAELEFDIRPTAVSRMDGTAEGAGAAAPRDHQGATPRSSPRVVPSAQRSPHNAVPNGRRSSNGKVTK